MKHPIIEINNLDVSYREYPSLTKSLKLELMNPKKRSGFSKLALSGISLNVFDGEVLGIIGSNGSGKSTLAKVIAGMVKPSSGWIQTRGTVSALIELSAGVYMDMSPYENVRFQNALLNLPIKESRKRAISICEYADLVDEIDKPLHTFSTGMAAKFAFSLATNIKPDILIIDEVFGVGDKSFVQKSRDTISSMFKSQSCAIVISHDLDIIQKMCSRTLWLRNGKIEQLGSTPQVIENYMRN